ncbi:MAG TPA: SRPBCC family protein [Vicinamibacterales bacterium]|nr:SRPBCC family protein [Vicinamibacterales bacterium]
MSNPYHFVTTWRVPGTAGEVADVLRDPLDLARWWPAVYLAVEEIDPPDDRGLHQRVRLRTKGWLPYTLVWEFVVTSSRYPEHFALEASGDFVGRGIWTIVQDGAYVHATYDWRITAEKPLLEVLAPLLRPLFEANHRWAMRQGEESLKLELRRRRAASVEALREIPPPPGPITYAAVGLLAGAAVIGGGAAYLALRLARNARRRRAGRARSD